MYPKLELTEIPAQLETQDPEMLVLRTQEALDFLKANLRELNDYIDPPQVVDKPLAVAEQDGVSLSVMESGTIKITPLPSEAVVIDPPVIDVDNTSTVTQTAATEQIIEGDYSRTKPPPNPIPITQFWSYCEQYFRNLVQDDLTFLGTPGDELLPFSIPPLGKHYTQQWAEEDARHAKLFEDGMHPIVHNREFVEVDDVLFEGDLQMGPLTERVLSCFLQQQGVVPDVKSADEDDKHSKWKPRPRNYADLQLAEERLKQELIHLGLYQEETVDSADDEIAQALRQKQEELRAVLQPNNERKQFLYKSATRYMAYQEYNNYLDEVNKNIEQIYLKRLVILFTQRNAQKSKKKRSEASALPESLLQSLHNRKRLLQQIGHVFFPPYLFATPTKSIFHPSTES